MRVETTLNIDDEIYFLHDKRVIASKVQGIKIEARRDNDPVIIYLVGTEQDKLVNIKVEQRHAFKSKAALVKSL